MCVLVYSRGHPFSYLIYWIQLVFGLGTCGYLVVFPRLKGRKHSSLFFLFDYFVAFITIYDVT
jgi:hypothetical protein